MNKENEKVNEEVVEETTKATEEIGETKDIVDEAEGGKAKKQDIEIKEEKCKQADEKEKKEKKKIFNKKDKKDQRIEELEEKHQRLMAEFQNYRNRSEKEKSVMFEIGAKSIIEKILPIVDNFERGIEALSEDDLDSPTGQGMNLIYKQLMTSLDEMGVKAIETKGQQFDLELHNAVMHEEDDEVGENMITQELRKGYTYRNKVIRHSMVKVAN